MKNKIFLALSMASSVLFAQNSNFWKKEAPEKEEFKRLNKTAYQKELPNKTIYELDLKGLRAALAKAPMQDLDNRRKSTDNSASLILSFPNSEGKMERYRVTEAPVMHPDLAAKYPNIKSYAGVGVDNSLDRIRFSVSPRGMQSMRLGVDKPDVFIEKAAKNAQEYTIFNKSELVKETDFRCDTKATTGKTAYEEHSHQRNADDGILRRYRIAIATTGEYSQFHIGNAGVPVGASDDEKKRAVMAAINATITTVNGIYERDFNVTLELIANNERIIHLDAARDPYRPFGDRPTEAQADITGTIMSANFDVGQVFGQGGAGGEARIGAVCNDAEKATCFTSLVNPQGAVFDVDYVSHEIGHQFGANHTWTYIRNERTNKQVEPGGGSTIMGYAGLPTAAGIPRFDVQLNSDPYFHSVSVEQVTDFVKGTACDTEVRTGNTTPVANAGVNYTIPRGTPFVLTGEGNDADVADRPNLTYNWEQIDENDARTTLPSVNAVNGVAFRSYEPTASKLRYFPRLETIKAGATSWNWEAVPNVARNLNFRFTVRDNRNGGGSNHSDDMRVTVNAVAGPFVVNSPNANVLLNVGAREMVRWDVAGTTANGVNAATVDILLSTDGGNTYPEVLANNIPNNGAHEIVIPNLPGDMNRIMVRGHNHIFFDISNVNFRIRNAAPRKTNAKTEIESEISIYPNPVLNVINVKSTNLKGVDYSILNTLGQEVKKGKMTKAIEVSDLVPTIYIISFKEKGKKKNIKFIKK